MIENGQEKLYQIGETRFHCGVAVCQRYIGGKWKAIIIWNLRHGILRFSEIKHEIPDMTDKMLSLQLKTLVADGIITKKITGTKAPFKVEYALTEMGQSLVPVIKAMNDWGSQFGLKNGQLVKV